MITQMHSYQNKEDYWRVRQFLREVFLLNRRRPISWPVARWDYWRWPGVESWGDGPLEGRVFFWEQANGQLAAVLNPESHGQAYLQVHPAHRSPDLEQEMLTTAEQHLASVGADGRRTLTVWTDSQDEVRQEILRSRGYVKGSGAEEWHCRDLSRPVPETQMAEGFTLRSLGDASELPARSWFSWKAFHPEAREAEYLSLGWEWYLDIQRCPLYRRDLDLVVVAPNGDLASFCTVWFDDVTRSAYFEPVATHAPYLRRGPGQGCHAGRDAQVTALGRDGRLGGGLIPGSQCAVSFGHGHRVCPIRTLDATVGWGQLFPLRIKPGWPQQARTRKHPLHSWGEVDRERVLVDSSISWDHIQCNNLLYP